mmetsp:Transcript_42108/g.112296  ORF Transcript_42108/g.112296 Transcript_42108/m.112296 type:complete len:198 (+) Transcript_42108:158-751(+)
MTDDASHSSEGHPSGPRTCDVARARSIPNTTHESMPPPPPPLTLNPCAGSLPPVNLGDDHSYATTNSEVEDDDHKTQTDMADDGSDGKSLLQFIISASKQDVEMIGFLKRTGDYPDLSEPSSCGNSPAYLAILHDRPEVLRILNEFDVDLAEPCDAVKFATPSYYCAYLGRTECLRMLAKCEVELETSSCNKRCSTS